MIDVLNITNAAVFLIMVALGLTIIFGVMKVINLAHGEFFMVGAYTAYFVSTLGVSPWVGILAAPCVLAILGVVAERTIIRPLYVRRDLSTLLATFGLALVLQQAVRLIFGPQSQTVAAPIAGSTDVFGAVYPTYRLVAMAIAIAVIVVVALLLFRSGFGTRVRATMEDPETAATLGTNVGRVYSGTFALGAALAGLAGALMVPVIGAIPTMGLEWVVRSFLVVITGGMGSVLGTVGGGVLIGGGESALNIMTSGTVARVGILLVAIAVILIRPQGLVARRAV